MKNKKLLKTALVACALTFSAALFGGCSLFADGNKLLRYNLLEDGTYEVYLQRIGNLSPMNYGVKEISIPAEYDGKPVTRIADEAFYDCDDMEKVEIPASIKSIGKDAFFYCISLDRVEITDLEAWCNIQFGSNPLNYSKKLYVNGELLTELVIPDTVTEIKAGSFLYCDSLTSVAIPDSVTKIDGWAFTDCKNIARIEIGAGVKTIGERAFFGCRKLVEVVNHSSYITVRNHSTENGGIGANALAIYNSGDEFTGTKVSYENDCAIYNDGDEKILVGYAGKSSDLVLPSSITKINKYAFYENENLTSVKIGDSVTEIGASAFTRCENLRKIVIPDSVISIGREAFSGCKSMTNAVIGENVEKIDIYAFSDCESLRNVTFKNPNGWNVRMDSFDSNFIAARLENLENSATALEYFKTYNSYYWKRGE